MNLAARMGFMRDSSLEARQRRHSNTQITLLALVAIFVFFILKTHDPEFEKPAYLLLKFCFGVGLLLTYGIEALWVYE